MRDDFAVFILSHGRAENVKTFATLIKQGYTGKIFIVIDDEDRQQRIYKETYGDKAIVFNKQKYIDTTDTMCSEEYRKVVVYARNACWDIAREKGLKYFCVLDDDYTSFQYRYPCRGKLSHFEFTKLDAVFDEYIEFLEKSNAITVCMAQGGDMIGGAKSFGKKLFMRKAMNVWFMSTERPFKFIGRINEDTNTYALLNQTGKLMITLGQAMITQMPTQHQSGGLTDVYLDNGTYIKSFFTVMCAPSCAKVSVMGESHVRVHHRIFWNFCAPKIINQKYKKQ